MPSAEVLDFAALLAPISEAKPVGDDPRTNSTPSSPYYAVKDARSAARTAERALMVGDDPDLPQPDWRPVVGAGVRVLTKQAKDLEVAAYMIEALVRRDGFVGLRDGFRLARELVEKYWDTIYPLPDEEGIETRVAPLTGLNGDDAEGTLIAPINRIPLTGKSSVGELTLANYQEALAVSKIADTKVREKKIAAGARSMDTLNKAVSETPPSFYTKLMEDLAQAQEEYTKLNAALDQRCQGKSPPSSQIRQAIALYQDVIKDVARAKLAAGAAPGKTDAAAAPADGAAPAAGATVVVQAADAMNSREDAFRLLGKVIEYFRKTEPQSLLINALEQVVRWGNMPLPELMTELIPEEAARKGFFKQVGLKAPEPPPKEKK